MRLVLPVLPLLDLVTLLRTACRPLSSLLSIVGASFLLIAVSRNSHSFSNSVQSYPASNTSRQSGAGPPFGTRHFGLPIRVLEAVLHPAWRFGKLLPANIIPTRHLTCASLTAVNKESTADGLIGLWGVWRGEANAVITDSHRTQQRDRNTTPWERLRDDKARVSPNQRCCSRSRPVCRA